MAHVKIHKRLLKSLDFVTCDGLKFESTAKLQCQPDFTVCNHQNKKNHAIVQLKLRVRSTDPIPEVID